MKREEREGDISLTIRILYLESSDIKHSLKSTDLSFAVLTKLCHTILFSLSSDLFYFNERAQ